MTATSLLSRQENFEGKATFICIVFFFFYQINLIFKKKL